MKNINTEVFIMQVSLQQCFQQKNELPPTQTLPNYRCYPDRCVQIDVLIKAIVH